MKKYLLIFLILCYFKGYNQLYTFKSTTPATINYNLFDQGAYYYLQNIEVTGLGPLDGRNIGLGSVQLFISARATIEAYLVAPNGYAVYLINNSFDSKDSRTQNIHLTLTQRNFPSVRRVPFDIYSLIRPYTPLGNLNSVNVGQNANGNWRLYAKKGNFLERAVIDSVYISFEKYNVNSTLEMSSGASNQSCTGATQLTEGLVISGKNTFNGSVLTQNIDGMPESKGFDVGSSGKHTETTAWYSFTPKCPNDVIQIKNNDTNYVQAGILSGSCDRRGRPIVTNKDIAGHSTYSFTPTFTAGKTYYLVLDGDEAEPIAFDIKWIKGQCDTQTPTITVSNPVRTTYCAGDTINIKFENSGPFAANNVFTAQLSNETGSFLTPIDIGTTTTGNFINARIPSSAVEGTGYKIRVVGSSPATLGNETINFEINTKPLKPASINGPQFVCPNQQNVTYTTTTTQPVSKFRWNLDNLQLVGAASDSSTITVNFNNTGGALTVSSVGECGTSDPISKTISVGNSQTTSISISPSKSTVCEGEKVIYSASAQNLSQYQWKVNGNPVGSNQPVFEINAKKGDTVWVEIPQGGACAGSLPSISNKIALPVNSAYLPTVKIAGNNTFCTGGTARFIASTTYGGDQPIFTWWLNQQNLADTDSVLEIATLKDKDTLKVVLQSNASCVNPTTVTSQSLILSQVNSVTPTITDVAVIQGGCPGQPTIVEAQYHGGGNNPKFTWLLNGIPQNGNAFTHTFTNIQSGDTVKAIMESDEACANPKTSTPVSIRISDSVATGVTTVVLEGDSVYCTGETTILQAVVSNASNPNYQWKIDGQDQQNSSNQFSNKLTSGTYLIEVTVTATGSCGDAIQSSATKKVIVEGGTPLLGSLSITGDTTICESSLASFSIINASSALNYQWKRNGNVIATDTTALTISDLKNNDTLGVIVLTTGACGQSQTLVSNQLTMDVKQGVLSAVSISTPNEICEIATTTLHASIANPGTNQFFIWKNNNQQISTDSVATTKLNQGSSVTLTYQAILACGLFKTEATFKPSSFKQGPVLTSIKGPDEFCLGQKHTFTTESIPGVTYDWQFPTSMQGIATNSTLQLTPTDLKEDSLKVSIVNECGRSNTVFILLQPKHCAGLFIPNAIIASSVDGNEVWNIKGIELYPEAKVKVFSRWGIKVFDSKGYTTPWDGTLKGNPLPTGTYYYVIEGVAEKPFTGDLTIVR